MEVAESSRRALFDRLRPIRYSPPPSNYTLSTLSHQSEQILTSQSEAAKPRKLFLVKLLSILGLIILFALSVIFYVLIDYHCFDNAINVHLVPHSHDDVGWIETPEQYYEHTVKYILSNVVQELLENSERKFAYSEMYYFWRWWTEQPDSIKTQVRQLVLNRQLEFVGGAWTMNDEAVTHYQTIIDQFSWGLRKLNETFGESSLPVVAWQIDTFGHSKEMVTLLKMMGFYGLIFARIDEQERAVRLEQGQMEFIWRDRDSSLLTSVMCQHYSPPNGFNFEEEFHEGPNVNLFIMRIRQCAAQYKTSNILIPMGNDFTYYNAKAWFENMDAMIKVLKNSKKFCQNVNLFYSTPHLYVNAIKNSNFNFPSKTGDFFPYRTDENIFWTGFYTSRPTLKYFERLANNFLQTAKQLMVLSKIDPQDALDPLREAVAVLTHHDAITGTAQQHVTDSYAKMLHEGISKALPAVNQALGATFGFSDFKSCLLLNISQCEVSEFSSRFVVLVYNTHSWFVSRTVRLPVRWNFYTVVNPYGVKITTQITPISLNIRSIPGRYSVSDFHLIFDTGPIPPLGFLSFYITTEKLDLPYENLELKNSAMSFDPVTGFIKSSSGKKILQSLQYYQSNFRSGAYIFHPLPQLNNIRDHVKTELLAEGPLVTEYLQNYGLSASQIIRTYPGRDFIEINWFVGSIPVRDMIGKEIISRFVSDINSGKEFVTDTNGRGRFLRSRGGFYRIQNSVPANYYPVTSYISISDNSSKLYIITDRAQGGTSLENGELELMVHRRLCFDDNKGVNEVLNETAFGEGLLASGRHLVFLTDNKSSKQGKILSLELQMEPWLFLTETPLSFEQWRGNYRSRFEGLTAPLPKNVRVLTLEPWKDSWVLLRIEHMFDFEINVVAVKLKYLIKNTVLLSARETTLAADRWLPNTDWLKNDMDVVLKPGQIRTFLITLFII